MQAIEEAKQVSRVVEHDQPLVLTPSKQAALDEIENIRAQGHASATHVKELEISCKPYVQRKEELRNIIRQNEQIKRSRQDAMEELVTDRVTKEHNATAWKEKKEQHAARAQEKEDAVTAWGERLQEAMDRAGEMCPRANIQLKGKSAKKLEANIASLEKALREREQRLGGSREEIYKRYVKANAVYEENHKIVKDLRDCAEVGSPNTTNMMRSQAYGHYSISSDYARGVRAPRQPLDGLPYPHCYESSYPIHSTFGSAGL